MRSAPGATLAAVWIVVAAMAGLAGLVAATKTADAESTPVIQIGGPFELIDQHGALRRDTDFKGRLMLVYFGYNYCPDICPTSLYHMSVALDKLGAAAANVQPIYITVDPDRDTVEAMADYAANFHPSLVALTGDRTRIFEVASAYKVKYRIAGEERGDDYLVDHSAFIYLMDRSGKFLRYFSHEAMADEIADGVREFF